jgi:hypothetical protein
VQKDVPGTGIKVARDVDFPYVFVAAVGIGASGPDAIMVGIPIAMVVAIVLLPTFVLAVVVAVAVITVAVFVPFMLTIVMTLVAVAAVVAILRRRGEREGASQGHEEHSSKEFAHACSPEGAKPFRICLLDGLEDCRIGVSQDDLFSSLCLTHFPENGFRRCLFG